MICLSPPTLLNESTMLRHRSPPHASGQWTNSPSRRLLSAAMNSRVRRALGMWLRDCLISSLPPCPQASPQPGRAAPRSVGCASVNCTTIARCTKSVQPDFGDSSRRRLSPFQVECKQITFRGWYLCKYINARTDATQSVGPHTYPGECSANFSIRIRLHAELLAGASRELRLRDPRRGKQ